jgi:predicted RNase H-like HicB family nuclease
MRTFNVVVERDPDSGTYVGYVPGWPGAHTHGDTLDELQTKLQEVLAMLLEDGGPSTAISPSCVVSRGYRR